MAIAHQWDYLFAIGTMFAFLDAFNIGANDVANSFATSVASKSLTLRQAAIAAALCEFLGAVLVGARVAGTIKNNIISLSAFDGNAGVQLLAFVCALTVSASWLTFCTRMSWPVSTTYSIVSALAGVGVAVGGVDAVQWGWNGGKGLATIFAGFAIAPAIAAGFGAVVFLLTKYSVLERANSIKAAFIMGPFFFFVASAVCTMSIVYKGAPSLGLSKLPGSTVAGAIVGTAAVIAALSILFWVPYVHQKVVRKDYTLRFYHFFLGPALWWRQAPADAGTPGVASHVPDYRVYKEEEHTPEAEEAAAARRSDSLNDVKEHHNPDDIEAAPTARAEVPLAEVEDKRDVGPWYSPQNLVKKVWRTISYGMSVDIHAMQKMSSSEKEAARLTAMHRAAKQYESETEHAFSFLQVLTACTASFAHGSNDVANAIGPYAAIYHVWSTSTQLDSKTPTPVWISVFGGAALVIGFVTYGYNIMRVLGNKLTLMSPSRGFSMEMGSAITVLLASQYGLPVSTTMCITGATLGVAMVNFDLKTYNWRALAWIVSGWIITVPVVGVLAGCLMGIVLNAPHFA